MDLDLFGSLFGGNPYEEECEEDSDSIALETQFEISCRVHPSYLTFHSNSDKIRTLRTLQIGHFLWEDRKKYQGLAFSKGTERNTFFNHDYLDAGVFAPSRDEDFYIQRDISVPVSSKLFDCSKILHLKVRMRTGAAMQNLLNMVSELPNIESLDIVCSSLFSPREEGENTVNVKTPDDLFSKFDKLEILKLHRFRNVYLDLAEITEPNQNMRVLHCYRIRPNLVDSFLRCFENLEEIMVFCKPKECTKFIVRNTFPTSRYSRDGMSERKMRRCQLYVSSGSCFVSLFVKYGNEVFFNIGMSVRQMGQTKYSQLTKTCDQMIRKFRELILLHPNPFHVIKLQVADNTVLKKVLDERTWSIFQVYFQQAFQVWKAGNGGSHRIEFWKRDGVHGMIY